MRSVSNAYLSKMNDNLRSWKPRVTIDGIEISGEITNLTINQGSCGTDAFKLGAVYIPYITATLIDCTTQIKDRELFLEMGLVHEAGEVEYIPIGYFTAKDVRKDKFTTNMTAYGRLATRGGQLYVSELTYPTAVANVIAEIEDKCGIEIIAYDLDTSVKINKPLSGLLCREALLYIAGLFGGFCTETSDGKVAIKPYTLDSQVEINEAFCYEYPSSDDDKFEITGIEVEVSPDSEDEDGNIVLGTKYASDTLINVRASNPYMTSELFEICQANTVGLEYIPTSVKFLGDIRVEPWDTVLLTGDDDVLIPCMNICHTWDGGLVTVVTSAGQLESNQDGLSGGPLTKLVERAYSELATVKLMIANRVKADELEAAVATFGYMTSNQADIKYATISNLNAANAQIESLKTSKLDASSLSAEVAKLGYASVSELNATNADIEELRGELADFEKVNATNLTAINAKFEGLSSVYATIEDLNATNADIEELRGEYAEFEELNAETFKAVNAEIGSIKSDYVKTATLEANYTNTALLEARYAKITDLNSVSASIESLESIVITTNNISAEVAKLGYATISNLEVEAARITDLQASTVKADELEATVGTFGYLKAETAESKYATIDNLNAANANISNLSGDFALYKTTITEQFSARDAEISSLKAKDVSIEKLMAEKATITQLEAAVGRIEELDTNTLKTKDLSAEVAKLGYLKVETASTTYATITNLNATNAAISALSAKAITTENLSAKVAALGYATVEELEAVGGKIDNLTSVAITTDNLSAKVADLGYLKADAAALNYATINNLNATNTNVKNLQTDVANIKSAYMDEAKVNTLIASKGYITNVETQNLLAGYATIDLANVKAGSITTAMIGSGVVGTAQIADGSITDAKIVGLTANKITAGKLDAAEIEVVNLNAANITVGTINGQQIASGAIDTTKLTSSLSSTISTAYSNAAQALTDIDNLSVGGRNILKPNTNGGGNTKAGTYYNVTITTNNSDTYFYINLYEALELGQEYTFSFKITGLSDGEYYNFLFNNKTTYGIMKLENGKRASLTFTCDSVLAGKTQVLIDDSSRLLSSVTTVNIEELKLEKGNVATEWTPAPEYVNSIIVTAQNTADGKNTVFYATSAPTANKVNDVWFDTDDGNKMYYWNGSAWTAKQFGTNAIANAAITNALIADATIQNAKIANLDASKITTGTLNASRIAAGSITTDHIKSGAINADKIAADAIGSNHIAANAVTAEAIVSGAITTDKIAANAVNANKIATGAVTADKLSVSSLEAIVAKIGGFTIGSTYLANNTTTLAGNASSVYVGTNGISCGTAFKVDSSGALNASNASIEGRIIASSITVETDKIAFTDGSGKAYQFTMLTTDSPEEGELYGVTFISNTFSSSSATAAEKYVRVGLWDGNGFNVFTTGKAYFEVQRGVQFVDKSSDSSGVMDVRMSLEANSLTAGSVTISGSYTCNNTPSGIAVFDSSNNLLKRTTAQILSDIGAAASSHTHSAATQSAAGFFSATDKKKLDGIASGANAYSHPTTSGNKHIPSGGSSGQILRWSADGTAVWGADNNTTYTLSSFGITATAAELNYCDGVTSNIQTQLNAKAASSHTHSYLPLSGGTLTGELLFSTGTTQSATKGIKWSAINSKNPYIGYATDQTDGTFVVCSLLGTNYATGLAIGGGSGNLLYKGNVVLNASNYTSYAAKASHNHAASEITSGTLAVERGGTGITSNPSMLVDLGSTSATNVLAASPRPGITGILGIGNGGTGASTVAGAVKALCNAGTANTAPAYVMGFNSGYEGSGYTSMANLRSAMGITDYVVEQGTSGIWTYRKWNSGVAECWGTYSFTAVLTSTSAIQSGTLAIGTGSYSTSFPSGLFTAAPRCTYGYQCSYLNSTAYASFVYAKAKATAAKTTTLGIARVGATISGNQTATVDFYAIGKWK